MRISKVFAAILLVGTVSISSAWAQEPSARIDQLEQQVRELTGQVEELTFELRQMRKRSAAIDNPDAGELATIQDGSRSLATKAAAASANDSANTLQDMDIQTGEIEVIEDQPSMPQRKIRQQAEASIYDNESEAVAAQGDVALAPAPKGLSRKRAAEPNDGGFQGVELVEGPQANEPLAGSEIPGGGVEQVALTAETPETLYKQSDEALLRRQFNVASAGFKKFLETYPDHSLAGSAQFWLGETYYTQGDFRTAAQNYLSAYKNYPKSRRAPDSLLKLGLALNKLGQRDQGCAALANLPGEFPKAAEAKKRAQAEFRRAGC
jgi:tol-pal system protein YbgF